jgi:NAD(P)-dependent dehydrogenase (short-subunit alcohol dehydrogenase family)
LENPIQINKAFKSAITKFKGKLDSVILCHGVFKVTRILETSLTSLDLTMHVNVRACFHLISIAIPFLKISKGNIVAVSSVEAKIPTNESFLQCLSKSMLNALIECTALEVAPFGVRVNAVAPGITYTNLRVNEQLKEDANKDYIDKMGGIFPLNKQVYIISINKYLGFVCS